LLSAFAPGNPLTNDADVRRDSTSGRLSVGTGHGFVDELGTASLQHRVHIPPLTEDRMGVSPQRHAEHRREAL